MSNEREGPEAAWRIFEGGAGAVRNDVRIPTARWARLLRDPSLSAGSGSAGSESLRMDSGEMYC